MRLAAAALATAVLGCSGAPGLPAPPDAGPSVEQLAVAFDSACARKSDGTVWCWGANDVGQLGIGSTTNSAAPVQTLGLDQVQDLCVNTDYACALRADGGLWCWGSDVRNQLGDGADVDRHRPTQTVQLPADLTGHAVVAKHVRCGLGGACVITEDGLLFCWGQADSGDFGPGTVSTAICNKDFDVPCQEAPVQVRTGATTPLTGVDEVAVDFPSCARIGGDVYCWGLASVVGPTLLTGLAGATAIAAEQRVVCAIAGGALSCWGSNSNGRLGTGWPDTTSHSWTAVDGLTSDVIAVSVGNDHACAIKRDADLWCWGRNDLGQVGDGTVRDRYVPTPVLGDAVEVSAGYKATCARRTDGSVWCWGDNEQGQLGFGFADTIPHPTPVRVEALQ